MRISVHNKSPELFTVKLESPSRHIGLWKNQSLMVVEGGGGGGGGGG